MPKPIRFPAQSKQPQSSPSSGSFLDECLSLRQLAKAEHRSTNTIRKLIAEVDCPFYTFSGRKHYRVADLEECLRSRKQTLAQVRQQARRKKR